MASDGLWDVVSEADAVSIVDTALGGGTAELKVPFPALLPFQLCLAIMFQLQELLPYVLLSGRTQMLQGRGICCDCGEEKSAKASMF